MNDKQTIQLDTFESFRDCILSLAEQAQRQIVIYTPDMEPDIYDTNGFIESALRLIKRSRHTRIRILATETKYLSETGCSLLRLMRHSDEQFQIKKYIEEPPNNAPAYFICDDHSIVRRQNANIYRGVCYENDRARVKDQLEDFEQLWNLAYADPNLRQLTI